LTLGVIAFAYGLSQYFSDPSAQWQNEHITDHQTLNLAPERSDSVTLVNAIRHVPYLKNLTITLQLKVSNGSAEVAVMSESQFENWENSTILKPPLLKQGTDTLKTYSNVTTLETSLVPSFNVSYYLVFYNNSTNRIAVTVSRDALLNVLVFDYSRPFAGAYLCAAGILMMAIALQVARHTKPFRRPVTKFTEALTPRLRIRARWFEEYLRLKVQERRGYFKLCAILFCVFLPTACSIAFGLFLSQVSAMPEFYLNVVADYLVRGILYGFLIGLCIGAFVTLWLTVAYAKLGELDFYISYKLGYFRLYSPLLERKASKLTTDLLKRTGLLVLVSIALPAIAIAASPMNLEQTEPLGPYILYFLIYAICVLSIWGGYVSYTVANEVFYRRTKAIRDKGKRNVVSILVAGVAIWVGLTAAIYIAGVSAIEFSPILTSSVAYRYFSNSLWVIPWSLFVGLARFLPWFATAVTTVALGAAMTQISLVIESRYKEIVTGLFLMVLTGLMEFIARSVEPQIAAQLSSSAVAAVIVFIVGYSATLLISRARSGRR
jgi:hypothetical protein